MHAVLSLFLFGICIFNVQCCIQMITKNNNDTRKDNEIKQNSTSRSLNETYCSLSLKKDLPKPNQPQPLYINPETNQIWAPNASGYLQIRSGAIIELYCSTTFANITTTPTGEVIEHFISKNTRTLKPKCIADKLFMWQGQKYEFQQFACSKPPAYTVEPLNKCCAQQTGTLFRIGFNITHNRFLETMRICYDTAIFRNHYTQYRLLPASVHFQHDVKRRSFSKAGLFSNHNLNFYYTRRNQWQRAFELLGGNNESVFEIFNDKELFLARGHLAAKADFIYANQQRSTFTFLNVAPQWQSFNAGQWGTLEHEVRKFLWQRQLEVICYTGTWGTLELKAPNRMKTAELPFYLAKDENNNDILPVPQLFYRVIVDRENPRRGIALLGINNPHATLTEILHSYIICEDIKEHVSWLRWIHNRKLEKGYIYACNVAEFFKVVNILPTHLNVTTELLS